ncbi:hypothetical protein [Streptomyces sp. HPF1205]|uniref:hypothetical protein n=1 Tax=Streptomyces sp. HPF1205 TaxID=2873262 RepID=UPI0035ABB000
MSDAAKRALRTALQTLAGLIVLLPSAAASSGLTATLPWAAGAVAVAGALSRLMALPGVQALLPSWLRTDVPVNGDRALRGLPDPASGGTGAGTEAGTGTGTDAAQGAAPATGFGFAAGARPAPGTSEEGSGA